MAKEGETKIYTPLRKQQKESPYPGNNSAKHEIMNENQKEQQMEIEEEDANQLIGSVSTKASNNLNSINFGHKTKNSIFFEPIQNDKIIQECQNESQSSDSNKINESNKIDESIKSKEPNKKYESNEPNVINESNILINANVPQNSNINDNIIIFEPEEEKKEIEIFKFDFLKNEEIVAYSGEYLNEIYLNLLLDEKQLLYKPKFGYMNIQREINEQMRAILMDWIVEVHFRFGFREETLFQTVWIIDTYLSKTPITRARLQLLGMASLLISCKSQEIYYPDLKKLIDIADGAYVISELLEMEAHILKVLNFNIMSPTQNDFYVIVAKAFNFDKKQYYLGKYFLESSLLDYQKIKYSPSVIGVSCAYIVMKYFKINNYKSLYSNEIIKENCPEKIIKSASRDICFLVSSLSNSSLRAVINKYSSPQFMKVVQLLEHH
jgi:hypothetical protein